MKKNVQTYSVEWPLNSLTGRKISSAPAWGAALDATPLCTITSVAVTALCMSASGAASDAFPLQSVHL